MDSLKVNLPEITSRGKICSVDFLKGALKDCRCYGISTEIVQNNGSAKDLRPGFDDEII
jgi:hypothetical protein